MSPPESNAASRAIQEFFLLEECVTRCEALADSLSSGEQHQALMNDLSECIAACQSYLAAMARESRYTPFLRTLCIDALMQASRSCNSVRRHESVACYRIAHASLRLLRGETDSPPTLPG